MQHEIKELDKAKTTDMHVQPVHEKPAMKRKHSWPSDLHHFLYSRKDKSFEYGQHDCSLFVADWIEDQTGIDVAKDYRGRYKTELGAAKLIKGVTGKASVEAMAEHVFAAHSLPELANVRFARRGDIVLLDEENGSALGIVHLSGRHGLFVSDDGLKKVKLSQCRRAWRLGHVGASPVKESK